MMLDFDFRSWSMVSTFFRRQLFQMIADIRVHESNWMWQSFKFCRQSRFKPSKQRYLIRSSYALFDYIHKMPMDSVVYIQKPNNIQPLAKLFNIHFVFTAILGSWIPN